MSMPPSTMAGSEGHGNVHIQIVHTAGISRVLYAPKNAGVDRLFTAGDDYLVRLLPKSHTSETEPLLIEDATAPITWIDADQKRLVVASEDGSVRLYHHLPPATDETQASSPTELVNVLTRTSLPTRCVALERAVKSGKSPRAAICSDELLVKLVDVEDTRRVSLLTGHSRAVRAASWSPTAPLLVTSSCDGTARLWDCSTSEPSCTKILDNLPASKPEDETDVHAEWHPSGQSFVLPSKGNELILWSGSSEQGWVRSGVFAAPARGTSAIHAPTGSATALSFSPNGRYLASATTDLQITIWETSSRTPVRARKAEASVTGISWHPDADSLAWIDTTGQLIRWEDVLGSQYASPCETIAFAQARPAAASRSRIDDLFAGTGLDDEDGEDLQNDRGRFVDDAAQGDDDDDDEDMDRGRRDDDGDDDDGLDGFLVDDDGGYSSALAAERKRKVQSKRGPATSMRSMVPTTKSQAAFQPNSTPMRNSRRFLSLSLFGSLVSIDQDTHHVVSFESFDTAARRNWKMVDHFGYSMASVASSGALLACPQKGEGKSAVHFKPFEAAGAWSTPGSEWSAEMPRDEEITAVALGGAPARRASGAGDEDEVAKAAISMTSTAIVATSAGYLRFFSSSGLQRYVWAFGQQIVALAAGKQHAIIVYRSQAAMDGYQHLAYTVIDLITFQTRQAGSLPLGYDVQLQWIGFNDLDVPVMYDTNGVMFQLDRAFAAQGQARWTPTLDSRSLSAARDGGDQSNASRTQLWPLAASCTQLFCIFVRGLAAFPDPSTSGHPLIQEVDLKLPLLGMDQPAGELEEKRLRQTLLASSIRSAFASLVVPPSEYAADVSDPSQLVHDSDKDLLQLIQLACKSDKHLRALDAARELHGTRMLDAALQIAGFFHLTSLADRMDGLREWIETKAERDERIDREGLESVPTDEFAEAASRSRRVLVESSQSPKPSFSASGSTSAHARKALTEDFHLGAASSTPRRSQPSRLLSSMAAEPPASSPTTSMPPPPGPRGAAASTESLRDHGHGDDPTDDISQTRKRKSFGESAEADDSLDFDDETAGDRRPLQQKQRSSKNPFNKTTLGATSLAAANRNPFARQPGMTRDRSMHKSMSFFDRAEADLTAGSAANNGKGSGNAGSKKTKQSVLFGGKGAQGKAKEPTSTPAFGETQDEESQGTVNGSEESLRLTLSSAVDEQQRRERRGGLEETQQTDEMDEDEETQQSRAADDNGGDSDDGEGLQDEAAAASSASGRSKLEAFRRPHPVPVA